jgi:hypothetical protein
MVLRAQPVSGLALPAIPGGDRTMSSCRGARVRQSENSPQMPTGFLAFACRCLQPTKTLFVRVSKPNAAKPSRSGAYFARNLDRESWRVDRMGQLPRTPSTIGSQNHADCVRPVAELKCAIQKLVSNFLMLHLTRMAPGRAEECAIFSKQWRLIRF